VGLDAIPNCKGKVGSQFEVAFEVAVKGREISYIVQNNIWAKVYEDNDGISNNSKTAVHYRLFSTDLMFSY
jgi:hypothetical protein